MADTPPPPPRRRETFSSGWGLILAALGMAIGTGNIWRFPRVLADNGGGVFLIPWAIFLFTWSIPLLMVEFGLGRRTGRGPIGAFATVFGARMAWLGFFMAMCSSLIMFYYAVVTGWCLRYLGRAIVSGFGDIADADRSTEVFLETASGWGALAAHAVAIALACGVVAVGVTRGIERVCKVLIPGLLVIIVIAAIRALTLPGAAEGISFLFSPDLSRLGDHKVWLDALSQSAWSTGAGWGLLMCYAIYAPSRQRVGSTCTTTGVGNNLASLLAALAIIPAVFALMPIFLGSSGVPVAETLGSAGPAATGVTFVWMPLLLERVDVFGWDPGRLPAVAFFLTLSVAAISSLIALIELGTRVLMDLGIARRRAVALVALVAFVCGAPSALSLEVFENQDWVWGLGLIVSGGLLTWGVISYGLKRFRQDFLTTGERTTGVWFDVVVGGLIPIQFLAMMIWWGYQAYSWRDEETAAGRLLGWIDPTDRFSIGSCIVQWTTLIVLGLVLNKWLARRTLALTPGSQE